MAFSTDSKYIITQSGAPDWTLQYWTWEKTKVMAQVRTVNTSTTTTTDRFPQSSNANASHAPGMGAMGSVAGSTVFMAGGVQSSGGSGGAGNAVHQVSFNPTDNTQLCVVGNGIFKLFRYQEGMLKAFAFQKTEQKVSF